MGEDAFGLGERGWMNIKGVFGVEEMVERG